MARKVLLCIEVLVKNFAGIEKSRVLNFSVTERKML